MNKKSIIKNLNNLPEIYTEDSKTLLKTRFLKTNSKGEPIETVEDMFRRVADFIAQAEKFYFKQTAKIEKSTKESSDEFFDALYSLKLIPNTPTLLNAGRFERLYSACFVLPAEDSLSDIMKSLADATAIHQYGGGTGWNFSKIREKGSPVNGIEGVAAGPVHFIKTFSTTLQGIRQSGKRGGGNMAILNIDHPDIEEFINMKFIDGTIMNFNISVGITDKFMECLKNDEEFELISRYNGSVAKTVNARELFKLITELAWASGDPGLAFVDKINNDSPTPNLGVMNATNPCGEQPLLPYESCNLAALNLRVHFDQQKNELDWKSLAKTIATGVHFLDNIIDMNNYPVKEIEEVTRFKNRKIGLGLMGFAEILFYKGIPYNSDEALVYAGKVMKFISDEGHNASMQLAKKRGTFPNFAGSKWDKKGLKLRNATVTTIAPNGNTSILGGCSGGIEPAYSLAYKVGGVEDNNYKATTILYRVNPALTDIAKSEGFYSKRLIEKLAKGVDVSELDEIPDEFKKVFVTAMNIEPEWHIKMQDAFQKYTDNAISKTINMPNSSTVDDVREVYLYAYDSSCKGVTIFRDGSKSGQTYAIEGKSGKLNTEENNIKIETTVATESKEALMTANAYQVLEKRALKKDSNGNVVETIDELWRRIAKKVASAEEQYTKSKTKIESHEQEFFDVMHKLEFLSGGTLIWAGMNSMGMEEALLSKCFVLPIEDSVDGIFSTLTKNIEVLKRGGGTGFNFSHIRSTYSIVNTTGENAAGPIEYMRVYNRAQDTLKGRGGRQMGSMAILNIDHPNIIDFITAKDNPKELTHFNISVGITDDYMKALDNDSDWDLIDPHDKKVKKTVKARYLWELISAHAWKSGDPGLFFLDAAERYNTTPHVGKIESTNVCGEQPLLPYESCNLGNINLSVFVKGFPLLELDHPLSFEESLEKIDFSRLEEVVRIGVRFLDNLIDINSYPVAEIEQMTKYTRNIGLGIMGFADMLVKLGFNYDSPEAVKLASVVMEFVQEKSHYYSMKLGEEKGSFPAFKGSVWERDGYIAIRNTRTTTIAPTGSVSIVANCNPGIEPIFALGYTRRNSMGGTDQIVIDSLFEQVAKSIGFYSEDLIKEIAKSGSCEHIEEVPEVIKNLFKTSHEIKPENHVRIQAEFQKYVDSGVSKTINMPNTATKEDIDKVYKLSFKLGCKGITIYRDGSKDQAQTLGTKENKLNKTIINTAHMQNNNQKASAKRSRPQTTKGTTTEIATDQGQLYITINEDEFGISEVFLNIGRSGGHNAAYTEALGRMISLSLRSNIDPKEIVKQLKGIRTSSATFNKGLVVYSVPDAVAKVLEIRIKESEENLSLIDTKAMDDDLASPEESDNDESELTVNNVDNLSLPEQESIIVETSLDAINHASVFDDKNSGNYSKDNVYDSLIECPDCGSDLEYGEGCILCKACGYSKCG